MRVAPVGGANRVKSSAAITPRRSAPLRLIARRPAKDALADPASIDRVLSQFANDVSPTTGTRFFELLVEYIATSLGFSVVVIGELSTEEERRVRALAAYPAGITTSDFTPTFEAAPREHLSYEAGSRARTHRETSIDGFVDVPLTASDGQMIGFICAFGHRPTISRAKTEMMFHLVADRAAAELERESARRRLERSEALSRGLLAERRGLEDRLRQLQRTEIIGRLAAGIAHDFGNILMVIRSHADIMGLRTPENDPRHSYVDAIRGAVTRGTGLARQLLAFNRHRQFELNRFDLNASIEEMTTLLRRLVGSGIRLATNLAPDARFIVADSTQIEQIILNLTINARDAMPDGGQITFETSVVPGPSRPASVGLGPNDYVCLSVADTGCGISDDVKGRMFDALFTTKAEGSGTGLGLATVHDIVTRHGGKIDVASVEGHGSTFRIYLPREQSARRKSK